MSVPRISCDSTDEIHAALVRVAHLSKLSRSDVIRQAITAGLKVVEDRYVIGLGAARAETHRKRR
jgi:uncharacterized protein (DUF1778 family)